jgi:hypothetical protein
MNKAEKNKIYSLNFVKNQKLLLYSSFMLSNLPIKIEKNSNLFGFISYPSIEEN